MNPNDTSPPHRLRIFLRDHRVLDASARIPAGQYLATYLGSRSRFLNLTAVDWVGTGSSVAHMALKVDHILWASSGDGGVALAVMGTAVKARRVQVELEGGYVLVAGLPLVEKQRLTDYLHSAPHFVPLHDAELRPRRKRLGDIVVNQRAIQLVREVRVAG